jgi:hypothetical protein
MEGISTTPTHLTPDQLVERWGGEIKNSTLRSWRYRGQGPRFVKVGSKVLYPIIQVEAYERAQLHSANSVKADESTERRKP